MAAICNSITTHEITTPVYRLKMMQLLFNACWLRSKMQRSKPEWLKRNLLVWRKRVKKCLSLLGWARGQGEHRAGIMVVMNDRKLVLERDRVEIQVRMMTMMMITHPLTAPAPNLPYPTALAPCTKPNKKSSASKSKISNYVPINDGASIW